MFRQILLAVCLSLLACKAFSADSYNYWRVNGQIAATPEAACLFINTPYSFDHFEPGAETYGNCVFNYNGNPFQKIDINRQTLNCPDGYHVDKNQNPPSCELGEPVPDNKCSGKKGNSSPRMHWLSATDSPSGEISVDGCAATVSSFICLTASPSVYSCTGKAEFTGAELKPLPTGTGSDCEGKDCSADDPQSGTKSDPCIKQDTGAGYTCTSTVEDSKVGETSCGTANGVYVCTPTTKPSKTTVTESVRQENTPNADGSLTTKNITTTTKTTCVADKCTQTSYTTTTKGGTTKTGDSIPDATVCTGSSCPSVTPGGGGGGKPVGSSDEDGTAQSSEDCAKPPECDGDVFMCAVLNQNFHDSCSLKALPTAKEVADKDQAIQKEVTQVQAAQDQMDSDVSGLLSGFKAAATAGGSGGKCYPDKEFSIKGATIAMPFSKICEPLILLRYALIAGAYLLSARILSREA